jgi:hypothetical protein
MVQWDNESVTLIISLCEAFYFAIGLCNKSMMSLVIATV